MNKKNFEYINDGEGNNYYKRNFKIYNSNIKKNNTNSKVIQLLKINNLKPTSILEIGCVNGNNLSEYQRYLKINKCVGIDLSSMAINDGCKKFKKIKLFKISSLDIKNLNDNFDLIICI